MAEANKSIDLQLSPGDRVIYSCCLRRFGKTPQISELPATFVRSQLVGFRSMYVITVDGTRIPRMVGTASVRKA